MNFAVAFLILNFIKKHLNIQAAPPQVYKIIQDIFPYFIAGMVVISFSVDDKYEPTLSLIWFLIYAFILYILWLLKHESLSIALQKAIFPYFLIKTAVDFCDYWLPTLQQRYDNFFDLAILGSFFWMVAFGISANNQQKALRKEEEKNKIVMGENEKLEELVKERTAEILEQKSELESTLKELKATQAQLIQNEKLASLGELTAGIAHEIQNPLNFVNNFSELSVELIQEIKDSPPTPEGGVLVKELLEDLAQNQEKINHHGKRASSIVKGMLEHSRTSTGVKELTDINKLADEYLRLSYHGLRAKDKSFNADFKTDFDEKLPKVEVIPQDIGRVLLNLINNAFQSSPQTPDGGTKKVHSVKLSTKLVAPPSGAGGAVGMLIISVTDNGTGMSEATKAKIFQPFFTTKPTGQGTGLGLSLAYDIVTKGHGGTIECESVEGVGSEFVISLPLNPNE